MEKISLNNEIWYDDMPFKKSPAYVKNFKKIEVYNYKIQKCA